jgi:hypothetical protein
MGFIVRQRDVIRPFAFYSDPEFDQISVQDSLRDSIGLIDAEKNVSNNRSKGCLTHTSSSKRHLKSVQAMMVFWRRK